MLSITPLQRQQATVWSAQILAALQRIEFGYVNTYTFGYEHAGVEVPLTVGAVWTGDTFSWRLREGIHDDLGELDDSIQFCAGEGNGEDAGRACGCLCFLIGQGLFKRVKLEAVQDLSLRQAAVG